MYNVVPGTLVEAKWDCDDCWGTNVLFSYHRIVGIGDPSAIQYRTNLLPTRIVYGDCEGSIDTLGASAYV